MSINADLNKLIESAGFDFLERAVARELAILLTESPTIGSIPLVAEQWAQEWGQDQELIWSVIAKLELRGLWKHSQGMEGDVLVSKSLEQSVKLIQKRRKTHNMKQIKSGSSSDKIMNTCLESEKIEIKSLFGEVAERLELDVRYVELKKHYSGWLPTSAFGANGQIYRPDAKLIEKLCEEFPDLDLELGLSMMYEDLRQHHKDRPSIDAMGYWMRRWLSRNAKNIVRAASEEQVSEQLNSLLDNY